MSSENNNINEFFKIVKENKGWCPLQFFIGLISKPKFIDFNNISLDIKQSSIDFLRTQLKCNRIKIIWAENEKGKLKTIHRYDTPELADKMYSEVLEAWSNGRDEVLIELTVEIYDIQN